MRFKNIPFDVAEVDSEEELAKWYTDDPEGFKAAFASKWEQYNDRKSKLLEGEPHIDEYDNFDDFERAKMEWSDKRQEERMTRAVSNALYARDEVRNEANRIRQRDLDFAMLSSPHESDRSMAKEILEERRFINDQLQEATRLESLGERGRAGTARSRAAMMTRHVESLRRDKPYILVKEDTEQKVENANAELEAATSEQIMANPYYYQGLIEAFNHESEKEFSYVLDSRDPDNMKIRTVDHAGQSARLLSQIAEGPGKIGDLLNLTYPLPTPEDAKRTVEPRMANDQWKSQKHYEQWREGKISRKEAEIEEETPSADAD